MTAFYQGTTLGRQKNVGEKLPIIVLSYRTNMMSLKIE